MTAIAKSKLSIDKVLHGTDAIMKSRAMLSSIDDINQAIVEGYAEAGMRGILHQQKHQMLEGNGND